MKVPRHVLIVSSPGAGGLHWSHDLAAAIAAECQRQGASTSWLAAVRRGQQLPMQAPAAAMTVLSVAITASPARVAADSGHLELELAVTRALRERPDTVVVHVGIGARGSPNVPWLAERLGARAFAVLRSAEVVCHRGDLVDRSEDDCRDCRSAERCRWCCSGWWRRPAADDFRNRADLLAASLQACACIWVPAAADVAPLGDFGLTARVCEVGHDAAAIVARVLR